MCTCKVKTHALWCCDTLNVVDSRCDLSRLTSGDGNVEFVFQHNVCGRSIYAEGTVDAALFLAKKVAESSEQRIFDMIDVLKAGAMR